MSYTYEIKLLYRKEKGESGRKFRAVFERRYTSFSKAYTAS